MHWSITASTVVRTSSLLDLLVVYMQNAHEKIRRLGSFQEVQMVECCRSGCEKAFWIDTSFDQDALIVEDKFPANMMLVTLFEMHY